jgi:hypothetical protein
MPGAISENMMEKPDGIAWAIYPSWHEAVTSVTHETETPMKTKFVALAATLAFTGSLQAHHNSGMFETTTPIRVKGVIAEVHFANPHSLIFVDTVDSNGERVRWAVENSGTLAMTRQRGFDEESVQVGDPIEACGYAPKRAYSTPEELVERGIQRPAPWWGNWDKVMTGRLLVLKGGPAEHWSHYGPLETCQALLQSE